MIRVTMRGSFKNTREFARRMTAKEQFRALEKFGELGVRALREATPKDSSETANHWSYEIVQRQGYYSMRWHNDHMEGGSPVAVLLQFGHGTRGGGWIEGRDYINPAMRPIFEQMANEMWRVVTK